MSEDFNLNISRAIAASWILASLVMAFAGCAAGRPAQTAFYPSPEATIAASARAPETRLAQTAPGGSVVRGQEGGPRRVPNDEDPGSYQYTRNRMPVSVAQNPPAPAAGALGGATSGLAAPNGSAAGAVAPDATAPAVGPAVTPPGAGAVAPLWGPGSPQNQPTLLDQALAPVDPQLSTPIDVYINETQTGRFMFGAGINSDAGVTGQIVIDERNFDITRVPTSWRDFADGTAFRGAGQGFRIEAMPGTQVQRYMASWTEPYLMGTPVSLNLSGFLYDRMYVDWTERRLGGRTALGYRLTPDLSVSAAVRAEKIDVTNPRTPYGLVPDLDRVLGYSDLFTGRVTIAHDTRDIPFSPTEGHLIELAFEQAFGDYSYPRADLDFRKYFLVKERPDGSGRHTLGYIFQVGFSGSDTPIFERYFAGGYSSLRGFDFRGASPTDGTYGVRVGGNFRFLGSAEYVFPLTADDMLKGALFVDYGTVERDIELHSKNFRIAPGFGVRINVPALGPAPLAFDFAFPVAKADTDSTRIFSFFFGVGR